MVKYKYIATEKETNSFIIEIEGFEGVYVKIEDIKFDEETNEPTFQIQLPEDKTEYFKNDAFIEAVQDAVGSQILWSTYRSEETMDVEVHKDPEKIKEDSIMVDFIKSFYEIVSGVKICSFTSALIL